MQEFFFRNATKTLFTLALIIIIIFFLFVIRIMKWCTSRTRVAESGRSAVGLPGEAQIFYNGGTLMPEPFPIDFDQRRWHFDPDHTVFSFTLPDGKEMELQLGSSDAFVATCGACSTTRVGSDQFLVTLRLGERILDTWQVYDFERMLESYFPQHVMRMYLSETKQVLIVAGNNLMITAERL